MGEMRRGSMAVEIPINVWRDSTGQLRVVGREEVVGRSGSRVEVAEIIASGVDLIRHGCGAGNGVGILCRRGEEKKIVSTIKRGKLRERQRC